MEVMFSQLKQKEVISLSDGKNLGRVCDLTFCYPENTIVGITVTGCKGFKFSKQEVFIPIQNVVKIGEDTVLVKLQPRENCPPPEKNCPPKRRPENIPPNCPPNPCPPNFPNGYPPNNPPDRRSYDEYE